MVRNAAVAWVAATGAASAPQSPDFRTEKRLCLSVAVQAANICFSAPRVSARTKSDASPVSAADFAIQTTVARALLRTFPSDVLIAEEDYEMVLSDPELTSSAQELVDFDIKEFLVDVSVAEETCSDRFWTLDPIDGTKGFLSSQGYAIGLALLGTHASSAPNGYPPLATLTLPHDNVVLLAEPGRGTFYELALDKGPNFAIAQSVPSPNSGSLRPGYEGRRRFKEDFRWLLSGTKDLVLEGRPSWTFLCCGSLVKYAAVARQRAAAFVQVLKGQRGHVWDHAAGVAVVVASGGNVTDENGHQVIVGHGKRRHALQLQGSAIAIVATAIGIDHELFCSEVRMALHTESVILGG